MLFNQFFLTRLSTSGILLSTEVRALAAAKLLILSISALTSFILTLRIILVAIDLYIIIYL